MSTQSVALDLEGTLANIHNPVWDEYSAVEGIPTKFEEHDSWDWPMEHMGIERFQRMVSNLWQNESERIEPMEEELDNTVFKLAQETDLDIVTDRQTDHVAIGLWLAEHRIDSHERFIVSESGQSKAELGYDVYIDDKPGLTGEIMSDQTLYLIKAPYNVGVRDHPRTIPVDTVREAYEDLRE